MILFIRDNNNIIYIITNNKMTDRLNYVKELLSFDKDYEKNDMEEHIVVQYKLKFDFLVLLASLQQENPNYFSKIDSITFSYVDKGGIITLSPLETEDMKHKLKRVIEMIGDNSNAIDITNFPSLTGKQIYTIIEYVIEKESSLFDVKQGIKNGFYIACDKPIWNVLVRYLSCENKNGFETNVYHKNLSKEKSCYILMKDSFGKKFKVFYLKKKDIHLVMWALLT